MLVAKCKCVNEIRKRIFEALKLILYYNKIWKNSFAYYLIKQILDLWKRPK